MSFIEIEEKDYSDGRTKQSFKDQCDITKIINRAQREGGVAHLYKYPQAVYGEFQNLDLLSAFGVVDKANAIYADLPSDVRKKFPNAMAFAEFASAPENIGRLHELMPELVTSKEFPNPIRRSANERPQSGRNRPGEAPDSSEGDVSEKPPESGEPSASSST